MNTKELLKKYSKPENFINRDLSWVEFNKRVLDEALNPELPLLDKIKFISIFCSNLDEFYMIRVSGIKEQIAANISEPAIDGLTPIEQLNKVEIALKPLLKKLVCHRESSLPGGGEPATAGHPSRAPPGGAATHRRSRSACASVPASTYSSSPPTGTPRARRDTARPRAASSSAM